jgi:long-chain acyl-CoA synthetase
MLKLIIEAGDLSALTSLKFIAVGGGKVAPELLGKAIALDLPVYEGYGLTECGSCVALNTPAAARVGSVGKPLRHANVRISNSGEVMVTGAAMSGYLDQQSGTTEIATGDSGFIDDDGYLYITGRIKNTIISSFGRNISPEWVESAFLAHPAVNQLAVFGEGEPSLSAVIVADEGTSDAQLMLIIKSINQSLPDYAQITRWHRSSEPFTSVAGTLTTNGKLRRAEIAKQFSGALVQAKAVAA